MLPVIYTPIAEKFFKKLKDKPLKNAFKEAIMSIRENPEFQISRKASSTS